jgi:hypothetical protein
MIRQILDELKRGPTTIGELARKLEVEQGALEEMLRFMARKGLIRELHPECVPTGCAGCPHAGRCMASPIAGYELVTKTTGADDEQREKPR